MTSHGGERSSGPRLRSRDLVDGGSAFPPCHGYRLPILRTLAAVGLIDTDMLDEVTAGNLELRAAFKARAVREFDPEQVSRRSELTCHYQYGQGCAACTRRSGAMDGHLSGPSSMRT